MDSSSPAGSNSSRLDLPSHDQGEHVDSPMRKKPRLDVSDMPSPASTPHDAPTESPSLVTTSPLSRVTINLRTSTSDTTSPQLQTSSDSSLGQSSDTKNVSLMSNLTSAESSSSSADSKGIEIEVDDPEDIGDEPYDSMVYMADTPSIEEELINRFPYVDEYGAVEIVKKFSIVLSDPETQVDLDWLKEIPEWLLRWLAHCRNRRSRWHTIYSSNREFWDNLGIMYTKFMMRRYSLGNAFSRITEPQRTRIIQHFFWAFLPLSAQLVNLDLDNMRKIQSGSTAPPELLSFRYLKALDNLFRPARELPLWHVLISKHSMDVEHMQCDLVNALVQNQPRALDDLIKLSQSLADRLLEFPQTVGMPLVWVVHVLSSICQHLLKLKEDTASEDPVYAQVAKKCLTIVRTVEQGLIQAVSKQNHSITVTVSEQLVGYAGYLLHHLVRLDFQTGREAFKTQFGSEKEYRPNDCAYQLQHALTYSIWWKFLTKGRMELRVLGAQRMDDDLLRLFEYFRADPMRMDHPVTQSVADFLVQEKVIEYIVGIGSHPQLIARSHKTAGFLIVSGRWTQAATDAIWNTIVSCPDPRIVTATLGLLTEQLELDRSPCVDLCIKLNALSISAFTPEVIRFTGTLLWKVKLWEDSWAGNRMLPFDLCVRIIREAMIHQLETGSDVSLMKDTAHSMLQRISEARSDRSRLLYDSFVERHQVYADCIAKIHHHSQASTGSIDVIYALLSKHVERDMPILIQDKDLLRTVAEDFCYFAESRRLSTLQILPIGALHVRLELFTYLVVYGPVYTLSLDLEKRLWSHLVGHDAINIQCREEAWRYLCKIVQGCDKSHPFVQRCMQEYLAVMAPSLLTKGMFMFVEAAIQYQQRVSPPSSPVADQAIQVPLADLLWQLILTAPDNEVANLATALMSQHHLDTTVVGKAPMTAISAMHTLLVTRCVNQLQNAASILTPQSDVTAITPAQSPDEMHSAELRFTRTLHFLRQFLSDVKERPSFKTAASVVEPSSPASSISSETSGQLISLKYQAFSGGIHQEIREIKIGEHATFADLSEKLRRVTGFSHFSVYGSGQRLDLAQERTQTVASLQKGSLLVKNTGSLQESPKPKTLAFGGSVAEQTVLMYFDTLYEFLQLKDKLSQAVYDFLTDFPPHARIQDLVLHESAAFEELFPAGKPYKSLYSFRALKEHLKEQLRTATEEDKFIFHGIRLLTTAFTSFEMPLNTPAQCSFIASLIDCLLTFLKERPLHGEVATYFSDEIAMVKQGCNLFERIEKMLPSPHLSDLSCLIYATILEGALHSRRVWDTFTTTPNVVDLHCWLLLSHPDPKVRTQCQNSIEGVCRTIASATVISSTEFAQFYWSIISSLIPKAAGLSKQSSQLLATAVAVFPCCGDNADESTLRRYVAECCTLMLRYKHHQVVGRDESDEFILGLCRLLCLFVSFLKSFKQPIKAGRLMRDILKTFLFPPLLDEVDVTNDLVDISQGPAAHSDHQGVSGTREPLQGVVRLPSKTSDMPSHLVIDVEQEPEDCHYVTAGRLPLLDVETRKEIYNLVLALCDNETSYKDLVDDLSTLVTEESTPEVRDWHLDRSKWLRSSTGYAGLRNLTNTCYMNSLVTQLFMNTNFRRFLLGLHIIDPKGRQRLLAETQKLFAHMQKDSNRFAETAAFADAIKPYEGDRIDVSVQMDVDEFYNLLFDRWESQIYEEHDKSKFRSFFGGHLVQQIKSKDCEHISEREEKFMAIQCEVRGKLNLAESLTAYVEGDVMEGENKYKCESCEGGRHVNAVKRACLKDVPDNLIFHLKRFDFDYTTLQRHKVNDRFEFPPEINMKCYKVDYLNDPEGDHADDVFELAGVLVHSGSAETGHYYSYTRLPPQKEYRNHWLEFNDVEVSDFDPNKIPDQCFGGEYDGSHQYTFPKFYNAYMIFYQRKSAVEADRKVNTTPAHDLPVDVPMPIELRQEIVKSNENLLHRFCLFNPSHAQFLKSVLAKMKTFNAGVCSESLEIERKVISLILYHLTQIYVRNIGYPDFESTLAALTKTISSSAQLVALTLDWMVDHRNSAQNLWLSCPSAKIRHMFIDFVQNLLVTLRNYKDAKLYGIDITEPVETLSWSKSKGALPKIVNFAKSFFPDLGKHMNKWNEYFDLWLVLVQLGLPEIAVLLTEDVFSECLEILYMDEHDKIRLREHHENTLKVVKQSRGHGAHVSLVRLVAKFLSHIDPYCDPPRHLQKRLTQYDDNAKRFPCIRHEYDLIHIWHARSKQLQLLGKAMDGWDSTDSTCTPGDIVTALLQTSPPPVTVDRIMLTIISTIDEYLPHAMPTVLHTAMYFCTNCSRKTAVEMVINAAINNIQDLGDGSRLAQGGAAHLDFIMALVRITVAKCFPGVEKPFHDQITSRAPFWGSALLFYDEKNVRERTRDFIQLFLLTFSEVRTDAEVDNEDLLEVSGAKAVGLLFDNCYQNLSVAVEKHLPSLLMHPTITVMQLCAEWACKLAEREEPEYQEMKKQLDCDAIVARWTEARDRLGDWQAGVYDAYSETEYDNASLDEESDELTDH